jgi:hypothetical protein
MIDGTSSKVWKRRGHLRHEIHSKFQENPSSGSKFIKLWRAHVVDYTVSLQNNVIRLKQCNHITFFLNICLQPPSHINFMKVSVNHILAISTKYIYASCVIKVYFYNSFYLSDVIINLRLPFPLYTPRCLTWSSSYFRLSILFFHFLPRDPIWKWN